MTIPSVIQGLIETEDGKVFELDTPKGVAWVEATSSFRFEPTGDSKAYTVRRETSGYWYGCRKIAGKVRKKYIGKSPEVTVTKLEEIAKALEISPAPQPNKVTQEVAQEVAQDRLAALELQVANLQKAVEALQDGLLGKLEAGDSLELPKVDNEVAEELQNELSNLKAENQKSRADYAKLLESSTAVTNKLRQELAEVRSQLATEQTRWDELREELDDRDEICEELRGKLADREAELAAVRLELSDLERKSATAGKDLPEAADLLNQLKTRRKKSSASLADVELILEMIEES